MDELNVKIQLKNSVILSGIFTSFKEGKSISSSFDLAKISNFDIY